MGALLSRIRVRWLKLRRLVLPWCMRRGCWERSHVMQVGARPPHRGNLCAVHFWDALQNLGDDDPGIVARVHEIRASKGR